MECDNFDAIVAGHICLDIIPGFRNKPGKELAEILSPGKSIAVSGAKISTGGAVSNTGMSLLKLGIKTRLMSKVNEDPFGKTVLDILKENKADGGITISKAAPTSFSVVISPVGIDRIFLHESGVNDIFDSADIDYNIVKQARLFHLGYPTYMRKLFINDGDELVKIYKNIKSLNVTTSLDLSLPDPDSDSGRSDWKLILKKVLPYVDIFTPSIEELLFMLRKEDYFSLCKKAKGIDMIDIIDLDILKELGEELLESGTKIAVIKCGKKGFYVRTQKAEALSLMGKAMPYDLENWGNRELFEEVYNVEKIASTNGSGDSSIAGFLASLLRGKTIEESIKIACATGALCIQSFEATGGIKTMEETSELIEKGWKKDRTELNNHYWSYDSNKEVWKGMMDAVVISDINI